MSDEGIPEPVKIGGKVYCNLRSTNPYNFVNNEGEVLGTLPGVSISAYTKLKMDVWYEEVDVLHAVHCGIDTSPTATTLPEGRFFIQRWLLEETLKARIARLQKKKNVDLIVVDKDVLLATAVENRSKFFLPMPYSVFHHRYYAHGIRSLVNSEMMNLLLASHPAAHRIKRIE